MMCTWTQKQPLKPGNIYFVLLKSETACDEHCNGKCFQCSGPQHHTCITGINKWCWTSCSWPWAMQPCATSHQQPLQCWQSQEHIQCKQLALKRSCVSEGVLLEGVKDAAQNLLPSLDIFVCSSFFDHCLHKQTLDCPRALHTRTVPFCCLLELLPGSCYDALWHSLFCSFGNVQLWKTWLRREHIAFCCSTWIPLSCRYTVSLHPRWRQRENVSVNFNAIC